MSFALLEGYIKGTPTDPAGAWRWPDLVDAAKTHPPDAVLSRAAPILKADAYAMWLRWFMEGVCNPLRYVDLPVPATRRDVYADVLRRMDEMYPAEPADERETVAQHLTARLYLEVDRRRTLKRTDASPTEKQDLVDRASGTPRCWLCGYAFVPAAVDRFLRKAKGIVVPQPALVDLLRPRGIRPRDVKIEVEHKVPVAAGGGGLDNLALACGWCNMAKGARTSLYDVDGRPPRITYLLGGHTWYELPHPFWTVRILATRGRCEHHSGCAARPENAELFIAPGDHRGSPNPSNLHVYCGVHDPYSLDRFVDRSVAKTIWDERQRASA